MIYYKVCTEKKGKYSSWSYLPQEYDVEYKLNETVYPKKENTYLFVFDDIDAALKFAEGNEVFECEADIVKDGIVVRVNPDEPTMEKFWKAYNSGDKVIKSSDFQLCYYAGILAYSQEDVFTKHTKFARSVRLLKQVN